MSRLDKFAIVLTIIDIVVHMLSIYHSIGHKH
jgi:hypothetical protein